MDKHIFLMANMGNSGGKWLETVCNIHEDVQVWVEANHLIEVTDRDDYTQYGNVMAFFMEQIKTNPKRTLGLIKAFDKRLIDYAIENGGTFLLTFRHPIGVVNFKTGHKMNECERRGLFEKMDTPEKIFEAHVEFYAFLYKRYAENLYKWPVAKLEDLKKSLRDGTSYFAETMKEALRVDWREEHTQKVIALGGLKDDTSHFDIWKSWGDKKREVFLKYFKDIMEQYNYKWE